MRTRVQSSESTLKTKQTNKQLGVVTCACNVRSIHRQVPGAPWSPSLAKVVSPWGSMVSQPSQSGESQAIGRLSRNTRWMPSEEDTQGCSLQFPTLTKRAGVGEKMCEMHMGRFIGEIGNEYPFSEMVKTRNVSFFVL